MISRFAIGGSSFCRIVRHHRHGYLKRLNDDFADFLFAVSAAQPSIRTLNNIDANRHARQVYILAYAIPPSIPGEFGAYVKARIIKWTAASRQSPVAR